VTKAFIEQSRSSTPVTQATNALRLLALCDIPHRIFHEPFICSVRNTLGQIINSRGDGDEKWDAARSTLKIEFKFTLIRGYRLLDDHHLSGVLAFLEHQLDLPLDQQQETHDEALTHAFGVLHRSTRFRHGKQFWSQKVVGWICRILSQPGHSRELIATVLSGMAYSRDNSIKSSQLPIEIRQQLSLALQRVGSQISKNRWSELISLYMQVLYEVFQEEPWHQLLIADHWQARDLIRRAGWFVPNIPTSLIPLLEQANNPSATKAWLEFAWRAYDELALEVIPHIVEATVRFLKEEEEKATILEFEDVHTAWITYRSQAGDRKVWSEEQERWFEELAEAYLNAVWKRPLTWNHDLLGVALEVTSGERLRSDSAKFRRIVDATLQLYETRGYGGMDEKVLETWIKAVWSRLDMERPPDIEAATLELFRQKGETAMLEIQRFLASPQVDLNKAIACMNLAGGFEGFNSGRYRELCGRLKLTNGALRSLDSIWQQSITTY
jgi:hypothetical protein